MFIIQSISNANRESLKRLHGVFQNKQEALNHFNQIWNDLCADRFFEGEPNLLNENEWVQTWGEEYPMKGYILQVIEMQEGQIYNTDSDKVFGVISNQIYSAGKK